MKFILTHFCLQFEFQTGEGSSPLEFVSINYILVISYI